MVDKALWRVPSTPLFNYLEAATFVYIFFDSLDPPLHFSSKSPQVILTFASRFLELVLTFVFKVPPILAAFVSHFIHLISFHCSASHESSFYFISLSFDSISFHIIAWVTHGHGTQKLNWRYTKQMSRVEPSRARPPKKCRAQVGTGVKKKWHVNK